MIEREVVVTTKHGRMPTFLAAPEGDGQHPGIIFYMDAPGIREELRNMARRIAKHGYVCLLPDMYYRLGTVRFDIPRRDDGMSGVIRASMNHLTNARVIDDTAALLAHFDALDTVTPGKVGCVGHCMSGQYITTVAAKFPHRMAAAASLYGVGIVTDKEDSPHLLLDEVKGELYLRLRRTRPIGAGARHPGAEGGAGQGRNKARAACVPRHASRLLLSGTRGLRHAGSGRDLAKDLRDVGPASEVGRTWT